MNNRRQLFLAIERGNVNTVRNLLNHVNINERDAYRRTPLGRAIAMGRVNVVRLLLQKGARVYNNNLGFIVRYMNNENYTANNRTLKNLISRALGRQARHRVVVASLREGMRRRRRAATTIQRHVRGTQLRARAGWHNPHTPVGYLALMKRVKRNMS
jgi:ankyrin repeat protein